VTKLTTKFGFALRVLEGDYLDLHYNVWGNNRDENDIRYGVELDAVTKKPVAYHFFTGHPAEGRVGVHRERVPADQVIHLYDPLSVHQTRGITWFTPAMLPLKMLQELMMAELVAARTAASKMGFITQPTETIDPGMLPDEDGLPDMPNEVLDASPGSLQRLNPGEEFQEWNPSHPSTAFEAFTKIILRSIASSLNVSYSNLSSDFTSENYSSARVGLLTERDHWREVQHWVIRNLHKRVYAKWLEAALLTGAVKLGTRSTAPFMDVEFSPRGWQWVDPQKEAVGNGALIGLGLTSRTKVCREQGVEIEDVFADLAREQELANKYGISVDGAKVSVKEQAPAEPAPTEEPAKSDPNNDQND
jgi:lambda family phage portal protein